MKVEDVMVRDLTAVTASAKLSEAVTTMSNHRIGGLPVVDENLKVVGFISIKDIIDTAFPYTAVSSDDILVTARLGDLARTLHKLGGRQVQDVMTESAQTITEDEDIEEIAAQMLARRRKIIPVIRDDRLIGIVRRRDLAVALIGEGEED